MNYTKRRWITLVSTIPISICIGSLYAWSVFSIPLSEELNVSVAAVTVAFTLSSGISGAMNILGGLMYDKYGPRLVLTLGGIFFGLGLILTGFGGSLIWLYITFGLISGIGLGASYCTFLMNTSNAFPDKRGLATGIIIATYGSGSLVFAPLGNYLIESFGVLNAFKIWGFIVFVIVIILSQFINRPPKNFVPEGWDPNNVNKSIIQTKVDKDWRQMLKDPLYYLIFGMVVIATTAGLMIMGHASAIIQSLAAVSAGTAAWVVGLISIANAIGRFLCPTVSDKLGRSKTLSAIFFLLTLVIFLLMIVKTGEVSKLMVIMLFIGFCYGGAMGLFPSITTDSFGTTNSGTNFGLVLLGATVGSFVGPSLASVAKSVFGSYTIAFVIAGALCLVGLVLAFLSGRIINKRA